MVLVLVERMKMLLRWKIAGGDSLFVSFFGGLGWPVTCAVWELILDKAGGVICLMSCICRQRQSHSPLSRDIILEET